MSSSDPSLSVVVANSNGEPFLRECLDSIVAQTLGTLEIVVYDDGSRDGSLAVLRDFEQRHRGIVRLLHDSVNRGAAHARHQAILAARGEYLTTLDSDDTYADTQKLARELDLARRARREEGKDVIAFSNTLLVRPDAPPCLWGRPEDIREGRIGRAILGRDCFIPRDFVMRRDLYFEVGGYDLGLRIYEDWDLKIRLAFRHEFRYTGGIGTAYRRHGRGLSSAPREEHALWLRRIFEKNLPQVGFLRRPGVRRDFAAFLSTLQPQPVRVAAPSGS